jgi:hypothetical protein
VPDRSAEHFCLERISVEEQVLLAEQDHP